ncbi:low molecular weight protein-tyrosine-phosphatase [Brevibacillus dissolubilis]|uniref:low molecular weight protein-tyrosine-phosphatase n=1 Tax=Brevibacillus dissolubilis TaxID=1844116 RepID=UPI00111600A1|nr:low molecular weight protein-tyrosine-phosphatase [Brevibacillus dissolubilis]
MIHVLFVCLGNICRSPMAEAVFRHQVEQAGLSRQISVDSCGLGGWHAGEPPHQGTRKILTAKGVSHDTLRARQIVQQDFDQFDYIVCMDEENLAGLKRLAPNAQHISRLMDHAANTGEANVEDPYYTGRFEYVYDLVEAGCQGLLAKICAEHGLSGTAK